MGCFVTYYRTTPVYFWVLGNWLYHSLQTSLNILQDTVIVCLFCVGSEVESPITDFTACHSRWLFDRTNLKFSVKGKLSAFVDQLRCRRMIKEPAFYLGVIDIRFQTLTTVLCRSIVRYQASRSVWYPDWWIHYSFADRKKKCALLLFSAREKEREREEAR